MIYRLHNQYNLYSSEYDGRPESRWKYIWKNKRKFIPLDYQRNFFFMKKFVNT